MIYSDNDLRHILEMGGLVIEPMDQANIQPSSIDLTLDNRFQRMMTYGDRIDPYDERTYGMGPKEVRDQTLLGPGDFMLASTRERVEVGQTIAARVEGKSSLARLGLIVHTTAGFIDPGFSGYITLELVNVAPRPIMLYAGMRIAQLAVFGCLSPAGQVYDEMGKYASQDRGPIASRYFRNERPKIDSMSAATG